MMIKEPVEVDCPACGHQSSGSLKWLLEDGRCCPVCSATFAPIQQQIRAAFKKEADFVYTVGLIVEIEDRFGIELSDDEACDLKNADALVDFVTRKLKSRRIEPKPETIRSEVFKFVLEYRDSGATAPDIDLFAPLRDARESAKTYLERYPNSYAARQFASREKNNEDYHAVGEDVSSFIRINFACPCESQFGSLPAIS